ncbi:MAG: Smr/MutS family protein [Sphingobacteriaceae bacterium]
MKYKLGDFVRFIDEKREGYVTRVINEQMVGVTDEDGFEIPVPESNLTHVHGRQTIENENQGLNELPVSLEQFQCKGVYLAVADDPRVTAVVHFHIINETSYQLLFTLTTEKQQRFKGEFAGIIAPKSTVKIYSAPLADLSIWPKFNFQVLYYSSQITGLMAPLVVEEKFKAKDFNASKKQVKLLNQPAWIFSLDQEEAPLIDAQKLKESFFRGAEEITTVEKPGNEIDLHIEKLVADHQFLNAAEILSTQLTFFRKSLDGAVVHKLTAIIFIHGTGNGTLRNEIHKVISKHPQVQTFKDARKEKFGYGATEIIFK